MITMQNHWQSNTQEDLFPSSKDLRNSMTEESLNGHVFGERSISAPPASEIGFDLHENSLLLGLQDGQKSNGDVTKNPRTWGAEDQIFGKNEPSEKTGLSLDPFVPGSHLNSQNIGSLYDLNSDNSKSSIGHSIIRSRSAAPQFPDMKERSIISPGLELSHEQIKSQGSSFPDYSNISNGLELQRPASTGVTGRVPRVSSSVMESLGLIQADSKNLKPKSVMDRIQEDFPRTPSPEFADEPNVLYPQRHEQYPADTRARQQSVHQQQYNDQRPGNGQHHNTSDVYETARRGHINEGSSISNYHSLSQASAISNYHQDHQHGHDISQVQAMSDPNSQQAVYSRQPDFTMQQMPHNAAPMQQSHHHQHPNYEPQQSYYNAPTQRKEERSVPPQFMSTGNGTHQGVYVNPVPYPGYAAVYHPAPEQPYPQALPNHVIHAHNPNIPPRAGHTPEYISVPIQHEIPRVAAVAPNGAYVYWQQPLPIPSTVDSNGIPTPVAMSLIPAASISTSQAKPTKHHAKSTSTLGKTSNDRTSRKPKGKKAGLSGSLDNSKHSSSSFNCSSLLEEFHSSKNRSWSMYDIKGHIVEFCQDQNGSRFIQQRLEEADDDEKTLVMAEVLPSVKRLRNDVFGNYVVQKLFDNGNKQMKSELKDTLEGEMLTLSTQMYGCRVVQKALECLDNADLIPLLSEFHENIIMCIHDQNGNHVIQKYIEVVNNKIKSSYPGCDEDMIDTFKKEIKIIVDNVLDIAPTLSCHPYGCRVLQRILEHCVDDEKTCTLDTIHKNHRVLLDDQYGNYVIQHVLQFGRHSDRESISKIVIASGLLALSRQKFASNVVEKLLKYGSPKIRNSIVREMLKVVEGKGSSDDGKGSTVVLLMVRDAYANYVVQTTLDVVPEGQLKLDLLAELNRNAALLRNYTFAKHIVSKLGDAETKAE